MNLAAGATVLNLSGINAVLLGLIGTVLIALVLRLLMHGIRGKIAEVILGVVIVLAALVVLGIRGSTGIIAQHLAHLFFIF